MPFSHGSRAFVGYRFALIEPTLCLATLLSQFRFVPKPGVSKEAALKPCINFLIQVENELFVVPELRQK